MSVVGLIFVLLLIAAGIYGVTLIPNLNPKIRWLLIGLLVFVAVLLVLISSGVWQEIKGVKVPKI